MKCPRPHGAEGEDYERSRRPAVGGGAGIVRGRTVQYVPIRCTRTVARSVP